MFLWMKLLHIAAVIAFLGNITTGLFWHVHAARTRDPRLLAHTMNGIIRSDRLFTVPGVVVIIATGIFAAIGGCSHWRRRVSRVNSTMPLITGSRGAGRSGAPRRS